MGAICLAKVRLIWRLTAGATLHSAGSFEDFIEVGPDSASPDASLLPDQIQHPTMAVLDFWMYSRFGSTCFADVCASLPTASGPVNRDPRNGDGCTVTSLEGEPRERP